MHMSRSGVTYQVGRTSNFTAMGSALQSRNSASRHKTRFQYSKLQKCWTPVRHCFCLRGPISRGAPGQRTLRNPWLTKPCWLVAPPSAYQLRPSKPPYTNPPVPVPQPCCFPHPAPQPKSMVVTPADPLSDARPCRGPRKMAKNGPFWGCLGPAT